MKTIFTKITHSIKELYHLIAKELVNREFSVEFATISMETEKYMLKNVCVYRKGS